MRSRTSGPTSRRNRCSTSARDRARRAGPRPKHSRALRTLHRSTPILRRPPWRWSSQRTVHAFARRTTGWDGAGDADLVIASYLVGELGDPERRDLVDASWARTRNMLVIVEPGTPAGYARIIAARAQLIASGAYVAAPCPHDRTCPLHAPD